MDTIHFFDGIAYFKALAEKNKLAKANKFFPCTCSGINSLEEVLQNLQRQSAFIAIDDTNDAAIEQRGGGWFKARTFTVFLMKRYKFGDMADRQQQLDTCRQLFRQIHSKLIIDKETNDELMYMDVSRIYSREFGQYFINGCTGLYFMLTLHEPVDLRYNESEWTK